MTFDEKKDAFIAFAKDELHMHDASLWFNYETNEFHGFSTNELFKTYLAGQASAIPDGYVLVPVEPTHDMMLAGDITVEMDFGGYDQKLWPSEIVQIYKAMIAAAQK